jgi:LysM repeat protein
MVRHPTPTIFAITTLVLAILPAGHVGAQESPEIGTHVVRPGDTLEEITAYYLGTPEAWPENHRLNPHVANPHVLFPGQRIRVLLPHGLPVGTAQLTQVSRGVEEQPTPVAWQGAREADLLRQKDLLRSAADQSARLVFGDGTSVTLGERSLLILREDRQADVRTRDRRELEIVRGQADLESPVSVRTPRRPIEVILGDAKARPTGADDERVRARAKRTDTGAAQVMAYEGRGVVEASGTTVELTAGTGTSVEPGRAPAPPESLLPAPVLSHPEPGASLGFANPALLWEPVEGAGQYVLEICGDPGCGRLLRRVEDLEETRWAGEPLPVGTHYWRVTPVSASGLDGYPAATRELTVASDRLASGAVTARVVAQGPQAGLGEVLVLGPGARLTVELEGETAGARFDPALDGREVPLDEWSTGWEPGAHQIGGTAVTAHGAATPLGPVAMIFDPEGPEVFWQIGELELLEGFGLDQGVRPQMPRRVERHREVPVYWSADGLRWLPLLPPDAEEFDWVVESDEPQVFLWIERDRGLRPDDGTPVREGDVIRIWVHDELSAAHDLVLSVTPESLEVVAHDLVGNETRRVWAVGG